MSFTSIKYFLPHAADRYKLSQQANASLVCQRARKCIAQHFSDFDDSWLPQKFANNILHIQCTNSSARAQLFMQKNSLLLVFKDDEILLNVTDIWIGT